MKKILDIVLVASIVFLTTGCGAMFAGTDDIAVSSTPDQIKVRVTNKAGVDEVFRTPFTYKMKNRRRDYTFTVISDEFESERYVVGRKLRAGIFLLDLLFTPFAAGLVIDFGSGNIYEHETRHLVIHTNDLVRKKAEARAKGKNDFVATLRFTFLGEDKDKEPAETRAHKKLKFTKIEPAV